MTWPWVFLPPCAGFDDQALFELSADRCLLMLTHPAGPFPQGPAIWKELSQAWKARR
jgi:hypothetical protein